MQGLAGLPGLSGPPGPPGVPGDDSNVPGLQGRPGPPVSYSLCMLFFLVHCVLVLSNDFLREKMAVMAIQVSLANLVPLAYQEPRVKEAFLARKVLLVHPDSQDFSVIKDKLDYLDLLGYLVEKVVMACQVCLIIKWIFCIECIPKDFYHLILSIRSQRFSWHERINWLSWACWKRWLTG